MINRISLSRILMMTVAIILIGVLVIVFLQIESGSSKPLSYEAIERHQETMQEKISEIQQRNRLNTPPVAQPVPAAPPHVMPPVAPPPAAVAPPPQPKKRVAAPPPPPPWPAAPGVTGYPTYGGYGAPAPYGYGGGYGQTWPQPSSPQPWGYPSAPGWGYPPPR